MKKCQAHASCGYVPVVAILLLSFCNPGSLTKPWITKAYIVHHLIACLAARIARKGRCWMMTTHDPA
jgi:hypothetical protein